MQDAKNSDVEELEPLSPMRNLSTKGAGHDAAVRTTCRRSELHGTRKFSIDLSTTCGVESCDNGCCKICSSIRSSDTPLLLSHTSGRKDRKSGVCGANKCSKCYETNLHCDVSS
ncbi:hypothetical protein PsorP6_002774 [Peronosclerospora sorghi]|uniref:Uncharacterized protein n=1 Tax=Peronosclerospora sorghi TaxID=230839 RepID=A0ACC0VKB6_9STRA|nr:hypothetical protein PsorP6_002774 [Peronosclerospora sorghi]